MVIFSIFVRHFTVCLVLLEVLLLEYFVLECSLDELTQGFDLIFYFATYSEIISFPSLVTDMLLK